MNRREFILNSSVLLSASVGGFITNSNADEVIKLPHTKKMPVLFIGHGSPMHAITQDRFNQQWSNLGQTIQTPHAILVISAHWRSLGKTKIMSTAQPETIHDFRGFPEKLYQQQYPAQGSPSAAHLTHELLQNKTPSDLKISSLLDDEQGLDHGTWCVLLAMYPEANIPVYQLSIDIEKPASFHYEIGKKIAALRNRGVLIMGSGNMIHNLRANRLPNNQPHDWALNLENYLSQAIENHHDQPLVNAVKQHEKLMRLAHPTLEHYYPLLYALGAKNERDKVTFFNTGYTRSSISMRSMIYTA